MLYIIDDDKNVRDGFLMLFKSAAYNCCAFESAEDFLKDFKQSDNDLLILDMHLIGMSGSELLEELTKQGVQLPVIILTAFDEYPNRNSAKKYGALAYLRKPVDSSALFDLIKFNLESQIKTNSNQSIQTPRSPI
jgi:FixJ family two-component response regulator